MIKLYKVIHEKRARDKKRKRYLLVIGKRVTHLTREELFSLADRSAELVEDYWAAK